MSKPLINMAKYLMTLIYKLAVFLVFFSFNIGAADQEVAEFSLSENVVTERSFEPPSSIEKTLLAPFYIPEYLLRTIFWPIEKTIEFGEKVDLPNRTKDFFSNEDHTIWFYPLIAYSIDEGHSLGLNFKKINLNSNNKRLKASYRHYANNDYNTKLFLKRPWNENLIYEISIEVLDNSNEKYYGIGEQTKNLTKTVYSDQQSRIQYDLISSLKNIRFLSLSGVIAFSTTKTKHSPSAESDEPSSEDVFTELPSIGFGKTLDFFEYGIGINYNSSHPSGYPYIGQVLEASLTHGYPIKDNDFEYIKTQLKISQFFDVYKKNRIVVVGFRYHAVYGNHKKIPFYELATLGKSNLLRGFPVGRFRDRKSISANIEYQFPIWQAFIPNQTYGIAKVFFDTGQTFGDFSEINGQQFHSSSGLGLTLAEPNEFMISAEIAYGGEDVQALLSFSRNL